MPQPTKSKSYLCLNCKEPVQLQRIANARIENNQHLYLEHYCECTPDALVRSKALAYVPALLDLFGSLTNLPLIQHVRPQADIERDLTHFRFDLDSIETWDELEWWMEVTRPRRPHRDR